MSGRSPPAGVVGGVGVASDVDDADVVALVAEVVPPCFPQFT